VDARRLASMVARELMHEENGGVVTAKNLPWTCVTQGPVPQVWRVALHGPDNKMQHELLVTQLVFKLEHLTTQSTL